MIEPEGRPAGFFSRLLAFVIDLLVVGVLVGVVVWVAATIDDAFSEFITVRISLRRVAMAAIPLIAAGYYVLFWVVAGRTIGKWIMGLRVVTPSGAYPSFLRAAVRFLGYLLSAAVLYAGYFWVLFDRRRKAWHDHLAGTSVVYDRSRRPRRSLPTALS